MPDTQEQQLAIVEELKLKVLEHMKTLLETKTITSTDIATLVRLLSQNGWVLDLKQVPSGLQDKLTTKLDPKKFDDDDADVLPLRARK